MALRGYVPIGGASAPATRPSSGSPRGYVGIPQEWTPAPALSPQQQHLVSSFKVLDPGTRAKLLTGFKASDPTKYSLLAPHVKDTAPATPNYTDNSIGGKIYRFDQGMNKTNTGAKKLAEGLVGGTVDFATGSGGQTAGETDVSGKNTASGKRKNVTFNAGRANSNSEVIPQAAQQQLENYVGIKALKVAKGVVAPVIKPVADAAGRVLNTKLFSKAGSVAEKVQNELAADHAAKTGQPIEAAHQTLASGNGEHADLYQAAGRVAHDLPADSTEGRTATVTKESLQPKPNTQAPQKSVVEKLVPAKVSKFLAGGINPERAAGREGNLELAKVAQEHTGNVNARELDNQKAVDDYKAVLKNTGVTHDQVIKAVESGQAPTPEVKQAADFFSKMTKKVGQEGVAAGTQKGYRENYVPRVGKFDSGGTQGSTGNAFGLSRNHRFNNERQTIETLDKNGNVVKTDKYPTHADFKAAVEKMGGKVQSDTSKLLGHVLSTEGRAIENERTVQQLEKVTMRDGRPAIIKQSEQGHSTGDYVKVNGRLVHPEAVRLYRAITEGSGVNGIFKPIASANSFGKRLVTLNGLVHAKNFASASIRNQGIIRTLISPFKGYTHEDVRRLVQAGFEPAKTAASNLYDEFGQPKSRFGAAGKWLGGIRHAADNALFVHYGDKLGISTGLHVEKLALKSGLTAEEASKVGADAANQTIFSIPKAQQSIAMRQASRVAFFAGKYLQSTFKVASNSLGVGLDKTLSKQGQNFAQRQAIKSVVRGFAYTFALAQAANYHATGRFTWQNPPGKQLTPVLYKDPKTGKEYYGTNFYGQLGDLAKMVTDPLKETGNKLAPGISAAANVIANHDPFKYTNNGQVFDPNASGWQKVGQVLEYALSKEVTPFGFQFSQNQGSSPAVVTALKTGGFSTSSAQYRTPFQQQILNEYQKTLPANATAQTPQDIQKQQDESQARQDLANGKKDSPALETVKKDLGPTAFKSFLKTGADSATQREFDKLPEYTKINILLKAKPSDVKTLDYKTFADNLIYELKHGRFDTTKGVSVDQAKQALSRVGYSPDQYNAALKDRAIQLRASAKASKSAPKPASQL